VGEHLRTASLPANSSVHTPPRAHHAVATAGALLILEETGRASTSPHGQSANQQWNAAAARRETPRAIREAARSPALRPMATARTAIAPLGGRRSSQDRGAWPEGTRQHRAAQRRPLPCRGYVNQVSKSPHMCSPAGIACPTLVTPAPNRVLHTQKKIRRCAPCCTSCTGHGPTRPASRRAARTGPAAANRDCPCITARSWPLASTTTPWPGQSRLHVYLPLTRAVCPRSM
jgi:hypothetical protein